MLGTQYSPSNSTGTTIWCKGVWYDDTAPSITTAADIKADASMHDAPTHQADMLTLPEGVIQLNCKLVSQCNHCEWQCM